MPGRGERTPKWPPQGIAFCAPQPRGIVNGQGNQIRLGDTQRWIMKLVGDGELTPDEVAAKGKDSPNFIRAKLRKNRYLGLLQVTRDGKALCRVQLKRVPDVVLALGAYQSAREASARRRCRSRYGSIAKPFNDWSGKRHRTKAGFLIAPRLRSMHSRVAVGGLDDRY